MTRSGRLPIRLIISGGQSGVDRGALDAAISLGLPHGGWCPRGRLAEDGPIPREYQLRETRSAKYRDRTERNVLESDATLILFRRLLSGGTALTRRLAVEHGKPHLLVDLSASPGAATIRQWLIAERVQTLNVAGPRESTAPGISAECRQLIRDLFGTRRR